VAIALESARTLVAGNATLAAPLLFLFNGGEETLSQAAHGRFPSWLRPLRFCADRQLS
jgi:hypothetical protein